MTDITAGDLDFEVPTKAPFVPPIDQIKGKKRLRKGLLALLAGAVIAAGAAYGAYEYVFASRYVSTDDAYVGANVAEINSQVSGPVLQVAVDDTRHVKKGDVLVVIDPSDAKIALDEAEANYRHTLQHVSQYYAQTAQAAANVAVQEANVAQTADAYARRVNLAESNAISAESLSTAKSQADAARANLAAARQALATQSQLIKGVNVADHPETLAAKAALDKARLDLSRTVIRAPIDGVVAQRKAQVGQTVQPGQMLMTVTPIAEAYVDANFKEGQLDHVRVGQPVTLTSDLYGSKTLFHGKVAGIGSGTGASLAVIPAQNATGNWIKVVQRLPVRVALDPKELAAHPLRVGLSMNATIDTEAGN
jgi:membrane fusion protein (multidrug efflux system)